MNSSATWSVFEIKARREVRDQDVSERVVGGKIKRKDKEHIPRVKYIKSVGYPRLLLY